MKNGFLTQTQQGNNDWWRYLLTLLGVVISVVIVNMGIQQILPSVKSLFPDNQFGKDLWTSILIAVVFTIALLVFSLVSKKLHRRTFLSYINLDSNFNWRQYFIGFFIWGVLLFCGSLITEYDLFKEFLSTLNFLHFLILLVVGFISIGIQSFFEEVLIRGYMLQGLYLKIRNIAVLVGVNALIFGMLHFGYGIESLIHSFTFGITFAVIVIIQKRIEFVSGAHNANNLILSLFFLDISEAGNSDFSWIIDWAEMAIHLGMLTVLVGVVYKYCRK